MPSVASAPPARSRRASVHSRISPRRIRPHRVYPHRIYLVDALTLFGLMVAITMARFGLDWPTYSWADYFVGFGVATVLHMTVYYFGGLYEFDQRVGRRPWLPRATLLTLMAVGGDATVTLLSGRYLMPRGNLAALAVAGAVLISVNRWVAHKIDLLRHGKPRLLLVGSPADVASACAHLTDAEPEAVFVGAVSDPGDILAEAERLDATELLLLADQPLDAIYPAPLGELERRGIGVFRQIAPADTLLGLQRSRQIGGMPFVKIREHTLPAYRLRFKRLLDLAYLVVLAPIALPLTAAVAMYVRLAGGRGVLYRQERIGRSGVPFVLVKFRTMKRDSEPNGPALAATDDPRVIRGMAWLRRSRLDELPQLWNVLVGKMSLVGPRPERPAIVARLESEIAGYGRRHDVPPGITGLAQTQGHYQTDPGYKLGHDLQYIVNWSPVLDWEIMAKSLVVMARRSAR